MSDMWVVSKRYEEYSGNRVQNVEISVVRTSYQLGMQSYGWEGINKVIIGGRAETMEDVEKYIDMANIICDAFNSNDEKLPRSE